MFSKKAKGIFVDLNDHTFSVARTSGGPGALVVEDLKTCSVAKEGAIEELLGELFPKRGGSGNFVPATCGVYAPSRLVRRATIEPKRFTEAGYLDEAAAAQCRITPADYMLAVVSAAKGVDLHVQTVPEKEVVFAGMSNADISATQKRLLDMGIFPEVLEIGSLSTLGALIDYLAFIKSTTPTLVLELGDTTTQSYVIGEAGLATSRPIPQGIEGMVPVVQKELGLKDEESARRLFTSNTFDFSGMAGTFTKKLVKELQSSIGFYEVQTGQSIGQLICAALPAKLEWLQSAIATQLGVESLKVDYPAWLKAKNINWATGESSQLSNSNLGIVSLLVR